MNKSLTLFLISVTTVGLMTATMAQQPGGGGGGQGGGQGGQGGGGNRNQNRQGAGMGRSMAGPTIKLGTSGVFVIQASGMMKLDPATLEPISQMALLPAEAGGTNTNSQRVPGPGDAPAAPPAGGMGMMMAVSAELGTDDAIYCVVGPSYVHINGQTMAVVKRVQLMAMPQMPQMPAPGDANQPDQGQGPGQGQQQMMQAMQAMQAFMQPAQMQLKGTRLLVSLGGRVFLIDTTTDTVLATFPKTPAK